MSTRNSVYIKPYQGPCQTPSLAPGASQGLRRVVASGLPIQGARGRRIRLPLGLDRASHQHRRRANAHDLRPLPALPFAVEEEDVECELHAAAIGLQAGDCIEVTRGSPNAQTRVCQPCEHRGEVEVGDPLTIEPNIASAPRRKGQPEATAKELPSAIPARPLVAFEEHEASLQEPVAGIDMRRQSIRHERDVRRREERIDLPHLVARCIGLWCFFVLNATQIVKRQARRIKAIERYKVWTVDQGRLAGFRFSLR